MANIKYVDLIGCGGTGSALLPHLLRLLEYHAQTQHEIEITLFDADTVSESNLERQQFKGNDIGTNKATSLIDNLGADITSLHKLEVKKAYVTKAYYSRILAERAQTNEDYETIVIVCVDNNASRKAILEAIQLYQNILFLSPGNELDYGQVICWHTSITESNPLDKYKELREPTDSIPKRHSCVENTPSSPQLLTTNLLAATYTLANLQCALDKNYYADISFFDLYKLGAKSRGELLTSKTRD